MQPDGISLAKGANTRGDARREHHPSRTSTWLVAIVGGAIATVIGGVVLYLLLPQQSLTPSSGEPAKSYTPRTAIGAAHLQCAMQGGVMAGRVYTFTIDPDARRAAWAEYGMPLEIAHLDGQRIHTNLKISISGWPAHDHVSFNFNRLSLTVDAALTRLPSPDEVSKCRNVPVGPSPGFCDSPFVVGEISRGACTVIHRGF